MSGTALALAAASVSLGSALALVALPVRLGREVRRLRAAVDRLEGDLVVLADRSRRLADQAAVELERVGDVLESAEAVQTTVDAASRLTYRALGNPLVRAVSAAAGVDGALRRFFGRRERD
ncbi:hypothetical protein ACFFRE_10645 [Aciditerrimonas ferrireducens]|uniref:DUF948 domain-containing protein n=1 Tax=Aciditerrimonas ferrireducens TaxID=667306 RepID=A0ABV6C8G6_9ACTN